MNKFDILESYGISLKDTNLRDVYQECKYCPNQKEFIDCVVH